MSNQSFTPCKQGRLLLLKEPGEPRRYFTAGASVRLLNESVVSDSVEVIRLGSFKHDGGDFSVTHETLTNMVRNFDANVYGQEIFFNLSHDDDPGAAGVITALRVESGRLLATVAWNEQGLDAIRKKSMRYVSAEYFDNYQDKETGATHGPTLVGAALCIRPYIKRMEPIRLTENRDVHLIHPDYLQTRQLEAQQTMNEFLKQLKAAYAALKLADNVSKPLIAQFEAQAKELGDDKEKLKALTSQYEGIGGEVAKQLTEAKKNAKPGDPAPVINLSVGMSEDDFTRKLKERDDEKARKLKERQSTTDAKLKIFNDAVDGAKGLSDDVKKQLKDDNADIITADLSDDQVTRLSESQIGLANRLEAAKQLSSMGFQRGSQGGTARIEIDTGHSIKQLTSTINDNLRKTSHAQLGMLKFTDDKTPRHPFIDNVLTEFDALCAPKLLTEARVLAGESTGMVDTDLPLGFQRTVIEQALSDLNILMLVQTRTDPNATTTTQIPYEMRDLSAIVNNGITFEGNPINSASVSQEMDEARIFARKLAMHISNEVMHFSRASAINWDAYARNVASNARVMRELVAAHIANDMQRTADAHGAVAVTGENIAAALDGTRSQIALANFPVVRPYQAYDLKGTAVGNAENPITINFGATAVLAYDGTGQQPAGTYYVLSSANMGYISFVDQTGAAVMPNEAAATINYSRATNIALFDKDIPAGSTKELHYNGLMQKVGARKAMMSTDRFVLPDYMLMSPVLNDDITNAEQYASERKRDGSNTNSQGDLERIKGIEAYGTNAPGIDLGDDRILLGQAGTTTYTIAKPYVIGQPFEETATVNVNGQNIQKPTGRKIAYGEEYASIHTPKPIRERMTSVIVYSATERAAV